METNPINTTHGLLWEQWRQSRHSIVGSGALLLMMALFANWNRPWVPQALIHDLYELEIIGWVAGLTNLLFFAPLVGIAFLFLGEDWSEAKEKGMKAPNNRKGQVSLQIVPPHPTSTGAQCP